MAKFFEPQDREWVKESGVPEIHDSHNQEPLQENILRKESTHPESPCEARGLLTPGPTSSFLDNLQMLIDLGLGHGPK